MKTLFKNERGVALIMVLTAIVILTALWGDFTFESKISRIKTTNVMDKAQAKLLAESGIELAMNRLRLFKEALNTWQSNKDAKQAVSIQLINQLWELPFVYPIPVPKGSGAQVKSSIDEFAKASILEGEFRVSIQNLSSKMNLNLLRVDLLKNIPQLNQAAPITPTDPNPPADENKTDQPDPLFSVEQQLMTHLTLKFNELKDKDEGFEDRTKGIEIPQLVANLKYYLSDRGSSRQANTQVEMLFPESEQAFQELKITPKHAPFSSFAELYLIPGWTDEIIDLIKDEFGVFPSVTIDLNKMTANMLKLLIPNIDEDDVKSFFEYRDNPDEPHFFNSLEDFQNYIVKQANLMTETNFKERFDKFKAQGIEFSAAPTLFKIISTGIYNRAEYTIMATVSIPTQATQTPQAPPAKPNPGGDKPEENNKPQQNAQPLLEPRIIEIQIN